jgi:hypothetical protein
MKGGSQVVKTEAERRDQSKLIGNQMREDNLLRVCSIFSGDYLPSICTKQAALIFIVLHQVGTLKYGILSAALDILRELPTHEKVAKPDVNISTAGYRRGYPRFLASNIHCKSFLHEYSAFHPTPYSEARLPK